MKKPTKDSLSTHAQHLVFVHKLICVKCDAQPVATYKFDGDEKLILPVCVSCLPTIKFKHYQSAKQLARHLWLLSGDIYAAMMAISFKRKVLF